MIDLRACALGTRDAIYVSMTNPTADRWQAIVNELDLQNAPDSEYRDILSTGTKNRLKKGETWRGRVLSYIKILNEKSTD